MPTNSLKLFSADSHVVEPGHSYLDYIESKYKKGAPHFVTNGKGGETLVVEGLPSIPAAAMASSGHLRDKRDVGTMTLAEINRGAFDPKQRLRDQDRDGVVGEVIYPTIAMFICGLEDRDFKQACLWAYNRWLKDEFISHAPHRLIGLGLTAVRSVREAADDVKKFKDMGFKGVMLPAEPAMDVDYDDKSFDLLWATCTELEMPITFHILSSRAAVKVVRALAQRQTVCRGPLANQQQQILRDVQDIIGLFIWSGVFERFPKLKLVCTEADAGWAPHYMLYADHYYVNRPDKNYGAMIAKKPSAYFMENVYMTFQRDWVALQSLHLLNPERLLWANDFPHPDSCWLESQDLLTEHASHLSDVHKAVILHDNVMKLYGLNGTA